MKDLILEAWHIKDRSLSGGPAWIDSDRFDVIAKAPPGTSQEDLALMLRALLIERFKLAVHTDEKAIPVYALVAGKRGVRLQAANLDATDHGCSVGAETGLISRTCHNMTMADLADLLSLFAPRYIDPVVDMTGIKGTYNFTLEWTRLGGSDTATNADSAGPTLFDAVRGLGLSLEPQKRPMPSIVIDHVERVPIEN